VSSLRCRAAVLAAANPVNGHYNKTKTVRILFTTFTIEIMWYE
jgi:DNA replicative helicase MCM subunit Mcm2 (Cdc46/Mcm family)